MIKLSYIKIMGLAFVVLSMLMGTNRIAFCQPVDELLVNQMLDQFESLPENAVIASAQENSVIETDNQLSDEEDVLLSLEGKRVSLDADNMNVIDAINLIAAQSQVIIKGQELLNGQLTIYFKDIDLLDALRLILDELDFSFIVIADDQTPTQAQIKILTTKEFEELNGYAFNQSLATKVIFLTYLKLEDVKDKLTSMKSSSGKIFFDDVHQMVAMIDQPERVVMFEEFISTKDVPLITKNFNFQYVQAVNVISSLESMLTKDVGSAKLQEDSKSVIVTDTENKIKEIEQFIKDLDQQNKQVVISAKVVQITLNQEHQSGIDWEAIVFGYQPIPFEGLESVSDDSKKSLSLGSVNQEDLKVLLEALDTVGVPNIISDSKLTVNFNEEFDVGIDARDLVMMSEADRQNALDEQKRSIKFGLYTFLSKDELLSLKILPHLIIDGKAISGSNEFKVDVKDGETVVIGGLFKNVTIASTRKIPLLGDLPFLGFVFRNKGQRDIRTETVLFLTLKTINK